jgi:hypothetical protein
MRSPVLLVLALATAFAASPFARVLSEVADARLVRAEVLLGETSLLLGSTSDDGKPDVDTVWQYLRDLRLQPTEAFTALRDERAEAAAEAAGRPQADRWTLRRGEKDPWIHLRIAYGGRAEVHALTLLRDEDGAWRVDPTDLERYADLRWIRRREAAALYDKR